MTFQARDLAIKLDPIIYVAVGHLCQGCTQTMPDPEAPDEPTHPLYLALLRQQLTEALKQQP